VTIYSTEIKYLLVAFAGYWKHVYTVKVVYCTRIVGCRQVSIWFTN